MGDWQNEGPADPQAARPNWDAGAPLEPSGADARWDAGAPLVPPSIPPAADAGTRFEPPPPSSSWAAGAPIEPPPVPSTLDEVEGTGAPVVERSTRQRRPPAPSKPSGKALWAYAIAGLAVGILIGVGLLVWQRMAMLSDQRILEGRLRSVETSATLASEEVASLQTQLSGVEASMAALATDNTRLASELTSAQAALSSAQSALAESGKTLTITERSVSPTSVEKSKPLVLEAKIKGKADKVQMKLVGVAPISYSQTYSLTKVSTTSGIETWKKTVTAPSALGMYRFYATAYIGTKSFEMPGVSAWSFEVKP